MRLYVVQFTGDILQAIHVRFSIEILLEIAHMRNDLELHCVDVYHVYPTNSEQ